MQMLNLMVTGQQFGGGRPEVRCKARNDIKMVTLATPRSAGPKA
jgi:hypothetical protein